MYDTILKTSAPGKLILLGEYAVLEKAPCLVSAVEKKCAVEINAQPNDRFRIVSSRAKVPTADFKLDEDGKLRFITELSDDDINRLRFVLFTIKHVAGILGPNLSGASIHINTDPFFHKSSAQKLGLGASAAITVSLLDALMRYGGKSLENEELYRKAYPIHREAQGGLGSGMDIVASATGGVIEYQLHEKSQNRGMIKPAQWPKGLRMLSIWAGQSASTQNMVQQVKVFRGDYPNKYDAIMEPMKQLSVDGCRAFQNEDVEGFMEIVSDFAMQEKKLGDASNADIISEAHQKIGSIVTKAGGTYKPSGAGGGDIGVAFCNDTETCQAIKDAVEKSRFEILDLPLQTSQMAVETT